jgi:hypothetical protein
MNPCRPSAAACAATGAPPTAAASISAASRPAPTCWSTRRTCSRRTSRSRAAYAPALCILRRTGYGLHGQTRRRAPRRRSLERRRHDPARPLPRRLRGTGDDGAGEVYELSLSPMTTSHVFKAGHRLRVEIASSKFPQYMRNLNTGGNNVDETEGRRPQRDSPRRRPSVAYRADRAALGRHDRSAAETPDKLHVNSVCAARGDVNAAVR